MLKLYFGGIHICAIRNGLHSVSLFSQCHPGFLLRPQWTSRPTILLLAPLVLGRLKNFC